MIAAPPPSGFHVNFGDLPTWLGVLPASVAAFFVYRQLRAQQEQLRIQQQEITRQLAAIERQQADDIDVAHGSAILSVTQVGKISNSRCWLVDILNSSRRPIRNVVARIEPNPGDPPAPADRWAIGLANSPGGLAPGATVEVLRKDLQASFAFKAPTKQHPDARITVRFTDECRTGVADRQKPPPQPAS